MNVTKALMLLAIMSLSAVSFSQNLESRLIDRMGENEIEKIYSYRYDYYHYLTYELDNGYVVKSKDDLSKDQRSQAKSIDGVKTIKGGELLTQEVVNNETFDFLSYSIGREMDDNVIYKLSKDSYMIVYSKQNISAMYKAKYGTQKRTTPAKK